MEYKFRGQRVDTKEWVYGNLIYSSDAFKEYETLIIPQKDADGFTTDYASNGENKESYGFDNWFCVIPETVGQCLCHKDIKGKEAYASDILKTTVGNAVIRYGVYSPNDGGRNILGYYVEFAKESNNLYYRKDVIYWLRKSKIVGNEFDNPELLEVE